LAPAAFWVNSRYLAALVIGVAAALMGLSAWAQRPAPDSSLLAMMKPPPPFTAAQAEQGRALYGTYCAMCHAADLSGGSTGRPLKGRAFRGYWSASVSTGALFKYIREKMPPGQAGVLTNEQYAALVAFLMQENGMAAGATPLPADYQALTAYAMSYRGDNNGGLALGVALPPWPAPPNPATQLAPVTDAMLADPPPGDWLTWRRTLDGYGFSPLKQIDRATAPRLTLAWSYNFTAGSYPATPLVHDGVMFVAGPNDVVNAFDAADGDVLWSYQREGGRPSGAKRNIALYADKVFVGTSDSKIVALQAATGKLAWESPALPGFTGGPLVIKGTVLQGSGRIGLRAPATCGGGGRIVGLDAESGALRWTFQVVPQPGEAGTESWNDIPCSNRSGGSVWTTSYYDPQLDLLFVGTGNTYDTGPLMAPPKRPGLTNDALYTNSTLALKPETGKLVWFYQHAPRDLWDLDWAFEQQVIWLRIDGKPTKTVVTMGKLGIADVLEAATGKYLFSLDVGLQNIVERIDPASGAKTYGARAMPEGDPKIVCPLVGGVRNWIPTSYDAKAGVLYAPLTESCMSVEPIGAGEVSPMAMRYRAAPRPQSDGRIGRVQAISLADRKLTWSYRQRAPLSTGVLATAGGVVFSGGLDRWFQAHDATTGRVLWRTRLGDIPTGAPISFTAHGKQYVAVVTGFGSALSSLFLALTPEIETPARSSPAVYVFSVG
jgi:alcohol dehydrogenase (cytochrome c)